MHVNFLSPKNTMLKISKSNKIQASEFLSPKNTSLRISKSKKYNASTIANFPKFRFFTFSLTILDIDCCSPTFAHLFSALLHFYTAFILFLNFHS